MFLCNPARPTTREQVSEWLRLAGTLERVAQNRFDEFQYSDRGAPLGSDPVPHIVADSAWKTANRLPVRATQDLPPQLGDGLACGRATACPMKSRQQAPRVPG